MQFVKIFLGKNICRMLKETASCFSMEHISDMIRILITEVDGMETKDVILGLRTKKRFITG